uniref:spherulation-specific family 4 protein n=1 Tax=Nitrososphaera sp. TaxID=1971748 RepID=UPI00307D569A
MGKDGDDGTDSRENNAGISTGKGRQGRRKRGGIVTAAVLALLLMMMTATTAAPGSSGNNVMMMAVGKAEAAVQSTTVSAVSLAGTTLHMWTEVRESGGAARQTGFTPLTFSADTSRSYTVTVYDYRDMLFDHWEDGSKERTRTISSSGGQTGMVAYYRTSEQVTTKKLTVNAVLASDGSERNMWTTIAAAGGAVLQTGFTPLAYQGNQGQYAVTVSDYQDRVFDHWEDGSTARTRTVYLSQDTSITAYYKSSISSTPPTPPPSPPPPQPVPVYNLTVKSARAGGDELAGMQVAAQPSGGGSVQSGSTPFVLAANGGTAVAVTAEDRGYMVFDHWEDGSTARTRTVTLGGHVTLTAYYRDTTPVATYTLSVGSADMSSSGNAINGYYTTIRLAGATVKTGFTPLVHTGTAGQAYSVAVSDYGGMVFDHWDDGSRERTKTVVLSKDTLITAYYRSTAPVPSSQPPSPSPSQPTPPQPSENHVLSRTGVFAALYMYPAGSSWSHWQKVIDVKKAHPSVPIVVVVNPSSGPGWNKDSNFASGIAKLQAAGVIVLGYTYDDYGTRSPSALRADVDK